MNTIKRLLILVVCCALCLLWGCKAHVTDGPDMEYIPQWREFSLSSSGSYAQENFWFTVTDDGEASMVTGECRDEDGDLYLEEEGIPIPAKALWELRRLNLDQLETYIPQELPEDSALPEDLEMPEVLDAGAVELILTLPNGQTVEKCITAELAITIYEILLPCLAK